MSSTQGISVTSLVSKYKQQASQSNSKFKVQSSQTEEILSNSAKTLQSKELCLESGFKILPHPQKEKKGGEDALFITEDTRSFGLADGVGGWAAQGVDPALYPKKLMMLTKDYIEGKKPQSTLPYEALEYAYYEVLNYQIKGSTTACVLSLNGKQKQLHTLNFGDSGFLLIREGKIIYQSAVQQSGFNMPYQLGYPAQYSTPIKLAALQTLEVQAGDIVVCGTDGLLDNLFTEQILDLISISQREKQNPMQTANILALVAQQLSFDMEYNSPFAVTCQKAYKQYSGGKPDDITVIVSYIKSIDDFKDKLQEEQSQTQQSQGKNLQQPQTQEEQQSQSKKQEQPDNIVDSPKSKL